MKVSPFRITLEFTSDNSGVFLWRIVFHNSLTNQQLTSIRGDSRTNNFGNFRWAAGIRGLAVLLTRHKLSEFNNTVATLEGGQGSIAASLDYAISKEPNWVMDLCGLTAEGKSVLSTLLKRINPERKRPGPVVLSFDKSKLSAQHVCLSVNGRELVSPTELHELLAKIEPTLSIEVIRETREAAGSVFSQPTSIVDSSTTLLAKPQFYAYLHAIIREEIFVCLRNTDIFTNSALAGAIANIRSNPSFSRVAGNTAPVVSEIDLKLSSSQRVGCWADDQSLKEYFRSCPEITIALSPNLLGTIALLKMLQSVYPIKLRLNMNFPHTLEIVDRLVSRQLSEEPDFCALGIATSGRFLSFRKKITSYSPFMLLPKVTQRVVAPAGKHSRVINHGKYLFMTDTPSGASFYFEGLKRSGTISSGRVEIEHSEPDEITAKLNSGDSEVRGILWFPHYHFNTLFNGCEFVDEQLSESGKPIHQALSNFSNTETLFFAHESMGRNPELLTRLNVALRNVWLELLANPLLVERITSTILEDSEYLRLLTRFGGLYRYQGQAEQIGAQNGLRQQSVFAS